MRRTVLIVIVTLFAIQGALAQTFNYGTGNISSNPAGFNTAGTFTGYSITGNDLVVNASASINMPVGTYNFANVTINTGATVTITSNTAPFILRCTGTFTNNGDLRGVGGNGGNASGVTGGLASTGVGGGAAGGVGGAGGSNGTSTTANGTSFGTSTGRGVYGCGPGAATRPSWGGPGGGGGSYGATGATGGNATGVSTGCSTGGAPGTVYGNATLTTQVGAAAAFFSAGATAAGDRWLLAGSGGAGGHGTQSIVASARAAGGGGGAGGAAIQIVANSVSIGTGAWVRARGGNGGNGSVSSGSSAGGGGGGGGSGGTINIQYMSSYSNSGTLQVNGGIGGAQGFGSTGSGGSGGNGGSGRTLVEQDVVLCTSPSTQATSFNFNTVTTTSCNVTFTRGNGTGGVLVVARQGAAVNTDPTSNTTYTANANFGSGSQIGTGNWVVYNSNSPSSGTVTVPVSNLIGGQTYHFAIYEYDATGTCYNMTELAGSVAIPICSPPSVQASGQSTPTVNATDATIAWTGNGNGSAGVIVVVRQGSAVNADPANTTTYTANAAFGSGTQIGTGNFVVYTGSGSSVNVTGLSPNLTYHYAIYTYNTSGPCYMTPAITGNFTAANAPMAYISSTTVQQTGNVSQGAVNQAILQVQIVGGTGTSPVLTVNSITFNINGSTSLPDIGAARIFYTGTSSTFATTTQFGADVTNFISGTTPQVVTGTQTLSPGTNYFWIAYDVSVTGQTGNVIDGECLSIDIGSTVTPTVTAPANNRPIISASSPACAFTYSSFTPTYSSIVGQGGTVVLGSGTSLNDELYTNIAMPSGMTFEYNGKVYSSFNLCANGFIWFGSYTPGSGLIFSPISTTLPFEAVISPLGGDLQAHSSATTTPQISYRLAGTAPNRTLTIQWTAFRQWGNTGGFCPGFGYTDWNRLDFQIILYENDLTGTAPNRIEFVYPTQGPYCIDGNSGSYQIGLRGNTNVDYLNRSQASGNWTTASTAAGGANNSTCTFGASNYINGNLGFRFTPTFQRPTVSPTPTATNTCPSLSVTLTGSTTATGRQWYKDGLAISGATNLTYTATQSGTYVFRGTSGACAKVSSPVTVTISNCGPIAYAVTGSNSCNSSTIGVANFEAGVSYQLKLNGVDVGTPITTGTPGSPISFGVQTASGTYTVVGTNGSGNTTMTGSVIVYGNPAVPAGLADQERCLSGNVTFTATNPGAGFEIQWSTDGVNNNAGTGLTYTVAVNPGSPVTMYARTRNTVGNCFSTWEPVVGIAHPAADPQVTASDVAVCFFDAIALLSAPDMVSYSWTGPNGFTSNVQNPFIDQVPIAATGTYNLSVIDTNGCSGSGSVSVTVFATCGTVTWEGDIDTDWNIGGNWNGGFVPSQLNDAVIPNVTNDPSLTTGADGAIRHVSIAPSATLNVGTGKKIGVRGNWNGAYNTITGAGFIEFNGAIAQTITGGGVFTNLAINNNNASGVTIAPGGLNQVKVTQGLNLQKATFTVNGNLYLTSTSTQTAYINNFSNLFTGTINGTITMERYNGGPTGFRYLSMPINNPPITQISEVSLIGPDMGQLIATSTCSPSNLAANSPYGNVMEWHEDGPFSPPGCRQGGWYIRSAGTLQNFRGYLVKMFQGQTIVVTGTPNLTSQTYATPLNNTNATGDGWHLMGNPYPSPLQWTGVTGFGDLNLFSTVGIYTGTYAAFAPVQNKIIASMQGFFVRRLGASPLTFGLSNASRRAVSTITYQSADNWYDHLLEIDIVGNGFGDHSTLYFNSGATAGYEAYYDARKMDGREDQPTIYTHLPNGTEQLGVNGLGSLDQTYAVPMVMKPGQSGEYTLNFTELATFPQSAMIYLEDLKTGSLTDLRVSPSYTFTSDVNDNPERFVIRFEPPVVADITDASCETAGSIEVTQQGNTTWSTYQLRDNNNNIYATGNNLNGSITFSNLAAQEYILKLTHPSGYVAEEYYTVNGVSNVMADMNISDNSVAVNEVVNFTANVSNATELVWDFGDGEQAIGTSVSHSYMVPGNYAVVLTASNETCDNVASEVVTVSTATGINTTAAEGLVINGYGSQLAIEFNSWGTEKADIFVFNALGQRVQSFTGVSTLKGRHLLNVDVKPGYYFIQVVSNGNVQGKKILLGTN